MLAELLLFAASVAPPTPGPVTDLADGDSIRLIAPDVWLYVSERRTDQVASNSLVVALPDGPLLVDPPWGDAQTDKVLDWTQKTLGRPVAIAVSTHSHEDRTGGIAAVKRRGIKTGALALTTERSKAAGIAVPDSVFTAGAFADPRGFELFFPGPGHAPDTIVVWLPKSRVLFGGCLVKSEDSADLGFVGEADLARWPAAIDAVRARYARDAAIVVPGHGPVGSTAALQRTLDLLAAARKTAAPAN